MECNVTRSEHDVSSLDRDGLLSKLQAIVTQQEATVTEQQRRIRELEARLSGYGSSGMPGNGGDPM